MTIPKQVQEATEKAEALMTNRSQEGQADNTGIPAGEASNQEHEGQQGEAGSVEGVVDPGREPSSVEKNDTDNQYKQRYDTLQGKYNAEVPRFRQQVTDLLEQNRQLAQMLQSNQGSTGAKGPEETKTTSKGSLLTDDEVSEYGPDFIDVIRRIAREEVAVGRRDIEGRVENVTQQVQMSAKDRFESKLTELVPDWEKWNVDQGFLTWLSDPDELSGIRRFDLFDQAAQAMDAKRVSKYFDAYKTKVGHGPEAQGGGKKNPPLSAQVTPDAKNRGAQPPSKPEKKIWSTKEIGDFYNSVAKGQYRGNPEERERIELDIMRAQKEGRIR